MDNLVWRKLFSYTIGIIAGTLIGSILFFWVGQPLGSSISDSHSSWYISRSTGLVAYFFAWVSMMAGLMITSRQAQAWPGVSQANDIHRQASIVSLIMTLIHVLVLIANPYLQYTWYALFIPDSNGPYAPIAVGIGQIALPIAIIISATADWRQLVGKSWRWIHIGAFMVFFASALHSIYSGTDTRVPFVSGFYVVTISSVIFMTVYRMRFRSLERKLRHVTA